MITVQTAHDLGAVWYRDRMSEDWQPPTAAQTQAIFEQFDLVGEFWRLS